MDILVNINQSDLENIELTKFQKLMFIYNALEDGWTIKKRNDSYIFSKKHNGQKEIFSDNYLSTFIQSNLDLNKTK